MSNGLKPIEKKKSFQVKYQRESRPRGEDLFSIFLLIRFVLPVSSVFHILFMRFSRTHLCAVSRCRHLHQSLLENKVSPSCCFVQTGCEAARCIITDIVECVILLPVIPAECRAASRAPLLGLMIVAEYMSYLRWFVLVH